MLKSISFKFAFVTFVTLFLLLMVYIIPKENQYSLSLLRRQQLEYINVDERGEVIYLLDTNNYIAKTNMLISANAKTIEAKARELLEILIVRNKRENSIPMGLRPIIPFRTKINSINYNNGVIEVDFSKQLLEIKKEYEEKMIEAIVYTLTSIDGVDKVLISVEKEPLNILPKTNIVLIGALDRTFGINKLYNLKNIKDITKVTIYYLNKYHNHSYYVPVTKYINDSREKIKIIIDELSLGPVYEPNLMSFLSTKSRLLNYEQQDNKFILHFNDYILADIKERNILEEVSYCIAYSVFANYNVDTVIFSVNEEIIKTVIKNVD